MSFQWSATRLGTYLECPRLYWFEYRAKPEVPTTPPFVFGGGIHETIAFCHQGRGNWEQSPERPLYFSSGKKLAGYWSGEYDREREAWVGNGQWDRVIARAERENKKGIAWNSPEQKRNLRFLGRRILESYYSSITNPRIPLSVIGIEFRLEMTLWGYPFTGYIDQVWKIGKRIDLPSGKSIPEGATAVMDLTTGKWTDVKRLQVSLYCHALRKICLESHDARKIFGIGPEIGFVWSLRTKKLRPIWPSSEKEIKETISSIATSIQNGLFEPSFRGHACRYCRYRSLCGKEEAKEIPVHADEEDQSGKLLGLALPEPSLGSEVRQLTFNTWVPEGGWIRGKQVRGKV